MRILLTGATGFLGFRTLEKLIQQSEIQMIIATGRTLKDSHKVDHPKVEYRLGDLEDSLFVESIVKDVDHIIHAAALSSPWGKREEFVAANVKTQQNLIASAKKHSIKKYVFVSTPSMYFEIKDKYNIKESDPLPKKFINAYAETKRTAEITLQGSGIPHVILRPRALTGRGDTVIMPRLIRAYDEGRLKIIGNGENTADLTSVANVADAIWLSLNANEKAINKVYNITNGAPVKLWDSIADVLRKLDREPPTKKVPFGVVKFIAQLMELKSKATNMKEPALTKYGVGTLAKSLTMDISEAKIHLGYEPKVSTEEAIEEFVNWYKENEKS
jgi:nucleoside-diphosphate-sugar epimerase